MSDERRPVGDAALGRAWQSLDLTRTDLKFPHCDGRPILAIYEQLLSMKHAAEIAQLSADDIQDIFWRNAAAAFGVAFGQNESGPPSPTGYGMSTVTRKRSFLSSDSAAET